ncbi:hypothetical protein M3Y98_00888300 [Aphelenchoides besseyi]|nr:hypothetical protein M3Y98_00888300 [Aphelenchoides besseyi]
MFSITNGRLVTDEISSNGRATATNGDRKSNDNLRMQRPTPKIRQNGKPEVKSEMKLADFMVRKNELAELAKKKPKRGFSVESHVKKLVKPYDQKKRSNLLTNYFVGNELHGIQQVIKARNRFFQIIWGAILIVICIVAALCTRKVFTDYLQHQTATTYLIRQSKRLEFPSVIVCPKNPDALQIDRVEAEVRRQIPQISNKTFRNLVAYAIADGGFSNMNPFIQKMNESDHLELTQLLQQWRGRRTTHGFYTDLFEKHGYRCEEMFSVCKHGSEIVRCCEIFSSHYVMLRGRCFRLNQLYQTDPDYQGRLYLGMNQLPSVLIEKNGLQPQVIAYIADPRTEMSTFPRYYIQYHSYNYVSVTMRVVKMLRSNLQCYPNDETRGRSACYLRKWLHSRIVEPFNCTPFYLHYRAPYVQICEPGTVARNYEWISNVALNGTKCLPSCLRHDLQYVLYTSENKKGRMNIVEKDVPDFRLELGYKDLEYEYYEERVTTSAPGFISEIGGQFGLFAGVTIITVIQLLLNLVMLIGHQLQRFWRFVKRINVRLIPLNSRP